MILPRRIVFVAGTLGKGGAERQLYYQATTLHHAGVQVTVIALRRGEFWEEKLRKAGIEVAFASEQSGRVRRMLGIGAMVRKIRPDVVQSAHFYANLYAWHAGKIAAVPSIGAVRSDCRSEVEAHNWALGRMCLLAPDWIAANSREAIAACISYGRRKERMWYLPNAIDTEAFRPRENLKVSEEIGLIWCGRMVPSKRPDWFVQVVSDLRRSGLPVRAWMIGDGPLLPKVRSLVQSVDECRQSVHVIGGVDDTAQWYGKADVLVLTSEHEGTPNVVLEAMSSGLAVVTTLVGGVQELLGEYSRVCVARSGERQSLRENLWRLLQNPAEIISIKSALRERAVSRFGIDALRANLECMYSAVLTSLRN